MLAHVVGVGECAMPGPSVETRLDFSRGNAPELFSGGSVSQILELIFTRAPLPEVLTGIGRLIETQDAGLSCTIWLLDEDGKHVHCVAAPSLPGFIGNVGRMAVGPRGASCGAAVYWRRPVYAADIVSDEIWDDYRQWLLPFGIRAAWSWPVILSHGAVLGTFALLSHESRAPTAAHIQLIESASRIVGFAIERHRNEEKLRAREIDFRGLVDSIPAATIILNVAGAVEIVNQAFLDYFGKSLDEIKGNISREWIHPDDRSQVNAKLASALASGIAYENESRQRRADSVYRWVQSRGFPLPDKDGQVHRWLLLITDIDDRRRAEAALAASERNLDQIINSIPALAWSALTDGSADFFNQHYLDYLGLTSEKARGWGWAAAVHPDDLAALSVAWQSSLSSGAMGEAEARLRRFDGMYRWFLIRTVPLRDEAGGIIKWFGVNTDIDDRKRAEEAQAASERNLSTIVNTMPGLASVTRADGYLEFLNQNYLEYLGVSSETVRTLRWDFAVHPEDADTLVQAGRSTQATGVVGEAEARLRRFDGAYRWFLCRNVPLYDEFGNVTKWFGVIVDIDERKRAEEQLRSAQARLSQMGRVLTMGQLTASIAHEVNQPLSGIITNASTCLRMLAADPPNVEGALETARRTIRDGNRASEVIKRLRALFSGRALTLERFDLNEAAREVVALSLSRLKANGTILREDLHEGLPAVWGDRVQLQQVILNMLQNASDAMSSIVDRQRHMTIRTSPDEVDCVRLTVEDTGLGFDVDASQRFFEPFYTTKPDGMGIGLSVSRSIVERHGGRIWATPNGGSGASFAFTVPISPNFTKDPGEISVLPAPGAAARHPSQ